MFFNDESAAWNLKLRRDHSSVIRQLELINVIITIMVFLLMAPSLQANETVPMVSSPIISSPMVRLILRPDQCVALHQGQDCYVNIKLNWTASSQDKYCLFSSQQSQAIQCWGMNVSGQYRAEIIASRNVSFTLRKADSKKVLASTELEMAWVYKKGKRQHSSWRVFQGVKQISISKPTILIVEDDVELAEWMCDYLLTKDYDVSVTHRGDEAVTLIQQYNPDVVILDGMLPEMDGIDVCKAVRPQFTNAIIMVTARDEEIDEVLGLEMGADDYLTKPVRARALLARIGKCLVRQEALSFSLTETTGSSVGAEKLKFDNLMIDREAMSVFLNGARLKISSNEFEVLWLLAKQAGQVVSREELVSQLRGYDYDGFDRSIDLRVSRLRKKLEADPADPCRIKTIWGKGYLFTREG